MSLALKWFTSQPAIAACSFAAAARIFEPGPGWHGGVVAVGELPGEALHDPVGGAIEGGPPVVGLVCGRLQVPPRLGTDALQGRDRQVRVRGELCAGEHLVHARTFGDGAGAGDGPLLDEGEGEGVNQLLGNFRVWLAHGLVFYWVEAVPPMADTGLPRGEATARPIRLATGLRQDTAGGGREEWHLQRRPIGFLSQPPPGWWPATRRSRR